jgi:DNA-binding winged helix-turn-helix (wHTH) protein
MPEVDAATLPAGLRRFRVGTVELDEALQELRVGGAARDIEKKPFELFRVLLERAPVVVSKRELDHLLWPNQATTDYALTTAMSHLRNALGKDNADLIKTVHRVGYRVTEAPQVEFFEPQPVKPFQPAPGDPVPRRPHWRLEQPLAEDAAHVWSARHEKTQERRVVKFAVTAEDLDVLKREAAISRILREQLGERSDIVFVLDYNFEELPCFIEMPFGGSDLARWAASRGGLARIPLAVRLHLLAQIARTVGDTHAIGVLHGDLKPGNILVREGEAPAIRLADFGAAGLTEAARRDRLSLSLQHAADAEVTTRTGTYIYAAPEVLAGGPPSTKGDVFALGILLYQMIVGDFTQPLAAGWEADIADELLRDLVARAAHGQAGLRLAAAETIADELASLEIARTELAQRRVAAAAAAALAEQAKRARLRRPWLILAAASLVCGAIGTGVAAWRAAGERDEARRQTRIANEVNLFLTQDLLGRGDPANAGTSDETLMQAVAKAEPRIAERFAGEKLVAGSLYAALATAYDARSAYPEARTAYRNAIDAFAQAEGAVAPDAVILRLRLAYLELFAFEKGSAARAKALMDQAAPQIDALGPRADEARAWLRIAQTLADATSGDFAGALAHASEAVALAEHASGGFSREQILAFKFQRANGLMHTRRFDEAEAAFGEVRDAWIKLRGPRDPNVLLAELELCQNDLLQGRLERAVDGVNRLYPELEAVFGKRSRRIFVALGVREGALTGLGRYQEAVADARTLYQAALDSQGDHSMFAIGSLADMAQAECRAGNVADGLRDSRHGLALAVDAFKDTHPLTYSVRFIVATCLVLSGQFDEAGQVLAKIDENKTAEFLVDPDNLAGFDLLRAAIASAHGQSGEARALLARPLQVFDKASGDPFMREWAHKLAAGLQDARDAPVKAAR